MEIHRSLGESHQLNVAKLRRVMTFWCRHGVRDKGRIGLKFELLRVLCFFTLLFHFHQEAV